MDEIKSALERTPERAERMRKLLTGYQARLGQYQERLARELGIE